MEKKKMDFYIDENTIKLLGLAVLEIKRNEWTYYRELEFCGRDYELKKDLQKIEIGKKVTLIITELSKLLGKLPSPQEENDKNLTHPVLFETFGKDNFEDIIAKAIIQLISIASGLNIDLYRAISNRFNYEISKGDKQ